MYTIVYDGKSKQVKEFIEVEAYIINNNLTNHKGLIIFPPQTELDSFGWCEMLKVDRFYKFNSNELNLGKLKAELKRLNIKELQIFNTNRSYITDTSFFCGDPDDCMIHESIEIIDLSVDSEIAIAHVFRD